MKWRRPSRRSEACGVLFRGGLSAAVGAGVLTVGIAAYLAYQCFNGGGGNPVNGRRLPAFLERRPQQYAAVSLNATSQGRHLSSLTPDRKLARVL